MIYLTTNSYKNREWPTIRPICEKFAKRYVLSYPTDVGDKSRGTIDLYAEFDNAIATMLMSNFKSFTQIEHEYLFVNEEDKFSIISAKELMDNYENGKKRKYWIDEFHKNIESK